MSNAPAAISADSIAPTAPPVGGSAQADSAPPPPPAPSSPETPSPSTPTETATPAAGTVDAKGTPFDAAKHLPRLHPTTGRWMPRGGRRPRVTPPASSSPGTSQPPADVPPAPSFIPPEEPLPPADDAEPAASASAAPGVDHSEHAGEVLCTAIEVAAGVVFDAPEDCTPPAAEHKNMVRAVAAYVRARGWHIAAGFGLALMFAAYLLRVARKPKPAAKVREWFAPSGRVERARDVTPENARPSSPISSAQQAPRESVIDLPRNIPPLA